LWLEKMAGCKGHFWQFCGTIFSMAKVAWRSELPVRIDRSSERSLGRQIYGEIAQAVLDGQLLPGSRLPSERQLSSDLGVARNTVNAAYDQLAAEGYIERVIGSGSRVSKAVRPQPFSIGRLPQRRSEPRLSRRGASLSDATLAIDTDENASEGIGAPALDAFPLAVWRRLAAKQIDRLTPADLGYGTARGYAPLRSMIADYLARTRRMNVASHRILIVAGAQQAYDLIARLLLDPGDGILFEEPGYLGARAAFLAADARLVPAPVDHEGMDVRSLTLKQRTARLAYTTPAHQFPLGPTLTLARRLALLEWAEDVNAWVVEDDYDGEFRYAGNTLSALACLDRSGRVIYVGSFSKILFPALRLGFMVVPENLAARAASARGFIDRQSPVLEQATLAAFMEEGHFARHVVRMRSLYAQRRTAAIRAFERHARSVIDLTVPETGVHLIARLRTKVDGEAVAAAVRACGLAAVPLARYYLGPPRLNALLVSFANLSNADVTVRRAVKAIENLTMRRSR
jgi:GntR family transcriptional regulator / MocR family aminotransferase